MSRHATINGETREECIGIASHCHAECSSASSPHINAIAPRDAAARVQAILTIDRRQAVAALSELIAEVLDLVELHMPEIDTSRTRMIQRMPARPCTAKPNLASGDDKR